MEFEKKCKPKILLTYNLYLLIYLVSQAKCNEMCNYNYNVFIPPTTAARPIITQLDDVIVASGSPAVFTVIVTGEFKFLDFLWQYGGRINVDEGIDSITVILPSGAVMNTFTLPSALVVSDKYTVSVINRVTRLDAIGDSILTVGKATPYVSRIFWVIFLQNAKK